MFYVSLIILGITNTIICENNIRPAIQYHRQSGSGSYNYGYDTGRVGSHLFHHENREVNGLSGPQGARIIKQNEGIYAIKPNIEGLNWKFSNSITDNRRQQTSHKPYGQSSPQSSRIYLAGRDYGEARTNSMPTSIHTVDSSPISRPLPRSLPRPLPRPVPRPVPRHVPLSAPEYYNIRSFTSTLSPINPPVRNEIRTVLPRTLPNVSPVAVRRTSLTSIQPSVTYSGRGILSPSAAARLRASTLRDTNITV